MGFAKKERRTDRLLFIFQLIKTCQCYRYKCGKIKDIFFSTLMLN
jgi:hypothetical protein